MQWLINKLLDAVAERLYRRISRNENFVIRNIKAFQSQGYTRDQARDLTTALHRHLSSIGGR
jgi:hypothetical protein